MSSNLKVNSLVPATGTEIGIGTTGGSIDFRCPATFGGNVTIGGTLTYDEVINIDSIGIITARTGLNVSSGTATFAGAIDANGDLDVDGHTNLDNVSIAGVTTTGNLYADNLYANSSLTINNNSNVSVNLTSTSTSGSSRIFFGDPDSALVGRLTYSHNGDYMQFFTAYGERLRIAGNGLVGIGTDNPVAKLQLEHSGLNAELFRTWTTTGSVRREYFLKGPTSGNGNDPYRWCTGNSHSWEVDNDEKMRIDFQGNVGINSTVPRGKLDIGFAGASNFITFGSDADNPKVEFFRHTGGSPSHYATEIQQVLGDLVLSTAATANLGGHSYDEKLRIKSDGRVSIGEANPSSDVTFTVRKDIAAASGNATMQIRNLYQGTTNQSNASGAEIEFLFKNHNASHNWWGGRILCYNSDNYNQYTNLQFHTASQGNAVERMRLAHDGDLTLFGKDNAELKLKAGTSSGNDIIAFQNSSGTTQGNIFYDTDHNFMVFKTNGTASSNERLRITSGGAVGINETSPAAQLHVENDNANASTYYLNTDAAILVQNKNSNATAKTVLKLEGPVGSGDCALVYGNSSTNLIFADRQNERLRITSDGYSKHTSGGGYDSYAKAVTAHEFRQYINSSTLWTSNTNTSQTWEVIRADSARSATNAMNMITTTTGNLGDDQHRLIGNGDILCDGTAGAGAADYAEYFEWTDGNSLNEDRRGMTVVLVDGKVRKTTSSDSADNIIGVVSANPVVVGDAQWRHWQSKYLRDDYGNYIYEDHNQITWTDDNGVKHDYEDWNVPSGITVPNVGVTTTTHDENGVKLQHQKLNPSYDASKTYIPRSERKEWDAIGMVGKLRVS